ncbi:hypothetical protein [Erythrobacter westpacificensis]
MREVEYSRTWPVVFIKSGFWDRSGGVAQKEQIYLGNLANAKDQLVGQSYGYVTLPMLSDSIEQQANLSNAVRFESENSVLGRTEDPRKFVLNRYRVRKISNRRYSSIWEAAAWRAEGSTLCYEEW